MYVEDLVNDVKQDFYARQKARKNFEAIWKLNTNYVMGNQYSSINKLGDIEEYDKQYFWQEREIFNHIAVILESRMSKLASIMPKVNVVPSSAEDGDVKVAKLARDVLFQATENINFEKLVNEATAWSELTGTSFYKVIWNANLGKSVYVENNLTKVHEGDVEVCVVSPYEIFPDNNCAGDIDDLSSIIHAKAYDVRDIKNIWGVDVEGRDIDVYSLSNAYNVGGLGVRGTASKVINGIKHNQEIVIERYEQKSQEFPNGRLTIVCGDKLLYVGELPYINNFDGKRGFPFVRQVCIRQPGSFWGTSIVERLIPIQRAYNAVKNRKHEYLNRLSMGVLMVEDGSVDIENLEEEGLSPGKVLVYRQGSTAPKMMQGDSLPADFEKEEEKLLSEFSEISGVSSVLTSSTWSKNLSGTALELMFEQDSARLKACADNIKDAIKSVCKHILKLYKQYAITPRLVKNSNSNGSVESFYWKNSDISGEDICIEVLSDQNTSAVSKREQVMRLVELGLLNDESGKLPQETKAKILEVFSLGVANNNIDLTSLQKNRAEKENMCFVADKDFKPQILEIDDHKTHIDCHIAFMLSKDFENFMAEDRNLQEKLLSHIKAHKSFVNNQNEDKN